MEMSLVVRVTRVWQIIHSYRNNAPLERNQTFVFAYLVYSSMLWLTCIVHYSQIIKSIENRKQFKSFLQCIWWLMAKKFSMSCPKLWLPVFMTVKMSKDITPQSLKNAERNMGPRPKWDIPFKWYWIIVNRGSPLD